jgi:hypothetical protein
MYSAVDIQERPEQILVVQVRVDMKRVEKNSSEELLNEDVVGVEMLWVTVFLGVS